MRLLGPVFWYDLVRVARRAPLALWRTAYGLGLLAALFVLYATALPQAWLGGHIQRNDAATFATRFFNVFTAVQFAAVCLITPALTANAVAEERSNNTLPFLLTTHLTNREIIFGKLLTRLLQVGLLILTGLPVLAIVQLLGGVEPNLVIATFVALAVTALNLGCLGLFCGVFVRKPQQAAWRAYQILIAYFALSFLSIWYWDLPDGPRLARAKSRAQAYYGWQFSSVFKPIGPFVPPPDSEPSLSERALEWLNVPNPYFAHLRLADLQLPNGPYFAQLPSAVVSNAADTFDQSLIKVLRDYLLAHGGLALLLGGLAVVRLRAVAAKQSTGITHKKRLILRPAPHPPLRDRPMLWKELYCESKPRQRWLRLFFGRWFFFASFFPAWFFIVLTIDHGFDTLVSRTLFLLRFPGTLVVGLLCLRIGLHAARSIGGERDRQTLDSLLTTQLTPTEIIRDKWWGSLLAGRWIFVWLLIHWCLGMVPLALHPLALPLLVLETLVYAAFAASLGMYCAVRFATTCQALTCMFLIGLIGTTLLPWGVSKFAGALLVDDQPPSQSQYYSRYGVPPRPWPEQVGLGLTPAWVLMNTVVPVRQWYPHFAEYHGSGTWADLVLPATVGLLIYSVAAFGLAAAARARFRRSLPGQVLRSRRLQFVAIPELRPTGIGS